MLQNVEIVLCSANLEFQILVSTSTINKSLWAAEKGHEAVVKLLVEKDAAMDSVDTKYDRPPLS